MRGGYRAWPTHHSASLALIGRLSKIPPIQNLTADRYVQVCVRIAGRLWPHSCRSVDYVRGSAPRKTKSSRKSLGIVIWLEQRMTAQISSPTSEGESYELGRVKEKSSLNPECGSADEVGAIFEASDHGARPRSRHLRRAEPHSATSRGRRSSEATTSTRVGLRGSRSDLWVSPLGVRAGPRRTRGGETLRELGYAYGERGMCRFLSSRLEIALSDAVASPAGCVVRRHGRPAVRAARATQRRCCPLPRSGSARQFRLPWEARD